MRKKSIKLTKAQLTKFYSKICAEPKPNPFFFDLANQLERISEAELNLGNKEIDCLVPIRFPYEVEQYLILIENELFLVGHDLFKGLPQPPQKEKALKFSEEEAALLFERLSIDEDTSKQFIDIVCQLLPVDIPRKVRNIFTVFGSKFPPHNNDLSLIFFDNKVILVPYECLECGKILQKTTGTKSVSMEHHQI